MKINPLKIKIMEFSKKRSMTAEVPGLGIIKAVEDNGRWIYNGRKQSPVEQRKMIDMEMDSAWSLFESMVPNLLDCTDCGRQMQEDVCLDCNREEE